MTAPQTPLRALSEGPLAPPRSSMEDADSSVTRKRPRLDSTTDVGPLSPTPASRRVQRSFSAEPAFSPAISPKSSFPPPTTSPRDDANNSSLSSTSSKTAPASLRSLPPPIPAVSREVVPDVAAAAAAAAMSSHAPPIASITSSDSTLSSAATSPSMSATRPSADATSSLHAAQDHPSSSLAKISPQLSSVSISSTPLSTPNKMTLNIRDASVASSEPQPSTDASYARHYDASHNPDHDGEAAASNADQTSPSPQTLAGSSPSSLGSPPIEVAELEDIDDTDTGPTVWSRPPGRNPLRIQEILLEQFPYREHAATSLEALRKLHIVLSEQSLNVRSLLLLDEWLDDYLHQTAEFEAAWPLLYAADRSFWGGLWELFAEFADRAAFNNIDELQEIWQTHDSDYTHNPLLRMLQSFAILTTRMMRIDLITLINAQSKNSGEIRELVSPPYLDSLVKFIRPRPEAQIWRLLRPCNWDCEIIVAATLKSFVLPPAQGLDLLSQLVKAMLVAPNWYATAISALGHEVILFTERWLRLQQASATETSKSDDQVDVPPAGFRIFESIDACLQDSVARQSSNMNADTLRELMRACSLLLEHSLSADLSLVQSMGPQSLISRLATEPDLPRAQLERIQFSLIEANWRLRLLKKCIMNGRMELRICAIDAMAICLLENHRLWSAAYTPQGRLHPVLQMLADFIIDEKLLDYIIGVDSHPQIITRSKDIPSFLVVTGCFSLDSLDLIWDAIITSQDPRTTEAVLDMLRAVSEHCKLDLLLAMSRKVADLPMASLDTRVLAFYGTVLACLKRQWSQTNSIVSDVETHAEPMELLLRMIRQGTNQPGLSVVRRKEIMIFALQELHSLAQSRVGPDQRLTCCQQALTDMAEGTAAAITAPSILEFFLSTLAPEDYQRLLGEFDLTSVVVNDLSRLASLEKVAGYPLMSFPLFTIHRLSLVNRLILSSPSTFGDTEMHQLWNALVGDQALSAQDRDHAFAQLGKTVHGIGKRNSFFDKCSQTLLPNLNPIYYTPSALDFAQCLTEYEGRHSGPIVLEEDEPLGHVQGELFWHIALCAPDEEIGKRATTRFVKLNVDDLRPSAAGRARRVERQQTLSKRCVDELLRAATKLKQSKEKDSDASDDNMALLPSKPRPQSMTLAFVRTFAILTELLQTIRSEIPNSPLSVQSSRRGSLPVRGEEITIRFQPHVAGRASGISSLSIGDQDTIAILCERLRVLTGFEDVMLIAGGRRVTSQAAGEDLIRDHKALQDMLVLVQKVGGSKTGPTSAIKARIRPLEKDIMQHFGQLYDFLKLDEKLASVAFAFLVTFPPHEDIVNRVSNESSAPSSVFPTDAPYQTLYSIYCLRGVLAQKLQEGAVAHELMAHGVQLLVAALTSHPAIAAEAPSALDSQLLYGIIDCLFQFLKESVPASTSSMYFEDSGAYVERLLALIFKLSATSTSPRDIILVQRSFETLLESSLHDPTIVTALQQGNRFMAMLQQLWLYDPDITLRAATVGAVKSICAAQSEAFDRAIFVHFFWSSIAHLIPKAVQHCQYAEQFFDLALEVFRASEINFEQLPLQTYLAEWTDLLLGIEHHEFPAQHGIEVAVAGLGSLLHCCIQFLKSKKEPLTFSVESMQQIFKRHLFPSVGGRTETSPMPTRVPVLESTTRSVLYSLLQAMNTGLATCQQLIAWTAELLPEVEPSASWSWGFAQPSDEGSYECAWNFDRLKCIRSDTGYAGLKNLSNTCYMNSLLTQLFMNPHFRRSVMSLTVTNPTTSQSLVHETQQLFGYLQETWLKGVDPESLANEIITFDGTPIDVTIQMDVDEFYNLLFDRWESQIHSDSEKADFRRLYGGQLVQQIKSQDCTHVSERTEVFSAIQCDIQGKSNLAESLHAYVEGEIMEGDNKYLCSTCGSYVNAVKRACLKDVPDNLIFHLKRFDYDLMSGLRSKINDYFEFPMEINMTPYTVDQLKDPSQPLPADVFKLVGILVHSGTAEAGHYYSYIRERPSADERWVEFNDADVTSFDPQTIRDLCYGGWTDSTYSTVSLPKSWSAYMLFYERADTATTQDPANEPIPFKVPLSPSLKTQLQSENEVWLRKYCLFDVEHARFARLLLESFRTQTESGCSDSHAAEQLLINFLVKHLERVFCRQRDNIHVMPILHCLAAFLERCSRCQRIYLDVMFQFESRVRAFILRCPGERVRAKTVATILLVLQDLREREPRRYGLDADTSDADSSSDEGQPTIRYLEHILGMLKNLQGYLHLHSRSWDDYWGLLASIAAFGPAECNVLHEADFLMMPMQVLLTDGYRHLVKALPKWQAFAKASEKRIFSLRQLTLLMSRLLATGHFPPGPGERTSLDSPTRGSSYELSEAELTMLQWFESGGDRQGVSENSLVSHLFRVDGVDPQACASVARTVLLFDHPQMSRNLLIAILQGASMDPAALARPHLEAALVYCELCPDMHSIRQIIARYAREVHTIGASGGPEHLRFFERARRVSNTHFSSTRPQFFRLEILKAAPSFAPPLVLYPDSGVREGAMQLLKIMIFQQDLQIMDDERQAQQIEGAAHDLLRSLLIRVQELNQAGKTIDIGLAQDATAAVGLCLDFQYLNPKLVDERIKQQASTLLDQFYGLTTASSPEEAQSDVAIDQSDEASDSGSAIDER